MVNLQQIEHQHLREDGSLAVHKVFTTIQGEGPFAGRRAVFVRLSGCNLQCPGCDTDYTSRRVWYAYRELVGKVQEAWDLGIDPTRNVRSRLVVLTGGEPFRQNFSPFVCRLVELGFKVQIETAGTLWVDGPWVQHAVNGRINIVCSPKTPKLNPHLEPHIDAYKYVVSYEDVHGDDGLPWGPLLTTLRKPVARPPEGYKGPIYIQPMDQIDPELNDRNREVAVASAMRFGYILCLQLHKLIGME